jgi:hypothetical protein
MIKYTPSSQLSISEFKMPFECSLDPTNRWVKLSSLVPWDLFASQYYASMSATCGAPAIDARIVLGVVILKHYLKLDDRGVIELIRENPYMQYFLGLKGFTDQPVFAPSLLVAIRKRIGLDIFDKLTVNLIKETEEATSKGKKKVTKKKDPPDIDPSDSSGSSGSSSPNQGKLQLDATVTDADIPYPTDLDLLNESREKSEELIDFLCKLLPEVSRPRTYRRVARKEYLHVSKQKKKSKKTLRRALRLQINYLERNIKSIYHLLDQLPSERLPFNKKQRTYFFVIQEVLAQQKQMFTEKKHSCSHRIVNIHQPHVRPIVRGKSGASVEFGAKINVSLQKGYARIDHFDWEAYNEGCDLISQVERYHSLHGYYPELLQVDKIYLTRANRTWLKERGIRHTGDPLGRKPKPENRSAYQKKKRRKESAERNQIEGKFGQGKNGYNLNNIRAKLSATSMSWIGAILFVMNLIRHGKGLFLSFFDWVRNKVDKYVYRLCFGSYKLDFINTKQCGLLSDNNSQQNMKSNN